jgi:hypothetical protein
MRLAGEGPVAVAGWCKRVGAVQGARLRHGRRMGCRPGEAPAAMSSSSSRSSSPLLVRRRRKGRQGLLGFGGAASGFLRGGPRVCGAGPDVAGGCALLSLSEAAHGLAGDASERGPRRKGKGKKGALRLGTCRGAEQAGRAGRSRESCGGERREEEEGKADKQVPLVSCPVREMRGRGVRCVWLGWVAACGGRKEGVERSWAGPCARSPVSRGEEEMGGGPAACWSSRFR